MSIKKILFLLCPLGIFLFSSTDYSPEFFSETVAVKEKQKGVCWVGSRSGVDENQFKQLAEKNIGWISQTPFGHQAKYDEPEILTRRASRRGSNSSNQTSRSQGLIDNTKLAKKYGIKTILKPHIWLRGRDGKWRGEIAMKSEEDWQKWFQSYEEFILHYAKIAEQEKIEILCIGTELHQTCKKRDADWRKLITKIKTVYSGKLTYAANFDREYEDVRFWDMLDYIGIQAYFPLSKKERPAVAELKQAWKKPIADLKKFSKKYNKPILFTEIGYKSTKDAAITPWSWPQEIDQEERGKIYCELTQAACYEAFFQTIWKERWLAGAYLWKWYPDYAERRNRGNNSTRDNRNYFNVDFTPQNKKAEEVMVHWYGLE